MLNILNPLKSIGKFFNDFKYLCTGIVILIIFLIILGCMCS